MSLVFGSTKGRVHYDNCQGPLGPKLTLCIPTSAKHKPLKNWSQLVVEVAREL